MRSFQILLPAAAALLALSACPSNCRKACENVATICAAEYAALGEALDVDTCVSNCEANLDNCKNMSEQEDCVAEKTACAELQKCPGCMQ